MTREEINAQQREWHRMLKAAHICRDCKGQDAYTLGGRTYCAECAAKMAAKKREARQRDGGKRSNQAHAEWRERLAAEGLCIYCGRRKAGEGRRVCRTCSTAQYLKKREKLIANGMNWPRGANGYCWLCNKRKAIEGKRLCPTCYEKRMRNLTPEAAARGRENQRRMGLL